MENNTEGEENNNKNSNNNNIIDNNNGNGHNKNNEKMNGEERWGTWEELLLSCAVKRHGLKNWESVSMEIQNKTSLSLLSTTPQICHQKYLDLKRRFTSTTSSASSSPSSSEEEDEDDDAKRQEDEEEDMIKIERIPWLDELRKLRVAELKREVQKYDVSILSLQLKVKRLKEERERSLKESQDNGDDKPDLEEKSKDISDDGIHATPDKSRNEKLVAVVGEDESENQSFNESNTTESKCENRGGGVGGEIGGSDEPVETEREEPVEEETGQKKPDPETSESTKPVSYNESSDSVLKKTEAEEEEEMKGTTVVGGGGEEPTTKESSDVQSSASLTGRKRRRKRGEEAETEEVSPATTKRICAKSQPLLEFLEIIRSHKHGSLFETRLHSQATERYKNIVRQHVDLKTIQTRLEEGKYSSCARRFYRDLLLLVSNAIVFYPKSKPECLAAHELRELVSSQMKKGTSRRPESSSAEPAQAAQASSHSKPGSDRYDSLLAKHKSSAPIVVCRKRSSLSAKPASDKMVDEKPAAADQKLPSKLSAVVLEDTKPKGKDNRPATGARSSRKNNKNRRNNTPNKNQSANTSSEPSTKDKGETNKKDKNANTKDKDKDSSDNASSLAKKRSAADFLKRIKRNSPNKGGSVADTPKTGGNGSNNGGRGGDQKKKHNSKGDNTTSGRRDPILQRTRGVGKQANEENSPSKRNVGRPPKKGAETISSKRSREVEREVVTTKQPPRKRTRR
ncbi:SANT/Myb domain [Dillenia turbinata]|uniref:SANT/Myb domain n=1 Tax=Dillenia turbinata TaxID=194707 RepID=A0AAN8ZH20_9MAGN